MMVANSANLIVTVKPVNQHNNVELCRSSGRSSKRSIVSGSGSVSAAAENITPTFADQEDDVIKDHLHLNAEHSSRSNSNNFQRSSS
jgi:partitioning defective protein 6